MIRRVQSLLMGLTALLVTLLLGLAPVQANTALGAYQPTSQPALGHQHAISLTALGNFDYHAKIASECCNATNSRPAHLTSHPNAHTIERHGPQVTDQQLETRALTGVAPDGSTLSGNAIPPLSSAFHSEAAMLRADAVMRNGPLQSRIAADPTATRHSFTFPVGEDIGRGYRRIGSSNPNNVGRNGPPERVDGLTHAQVTVVQNPTSGVWETITMFPASP